MTLIKTYLKRLAYALMGKDVPKTGPVVMGGGGPGEPQK